MPLEVEAWLEPHSQDDEDYRSQTGDLFRVRRGQRTDARLSYAVR